MTTTFDPLAVGNTRGAGPPTFGVEEEFLVVDPATGAPLPAATDVIATARRFGLTVQPELTTAQVEVNTPVCTSMRELREHLVAARAVAAAAALQGGGRLLAVGVPLAGAPRQPVTDADRYRRMSSRYGLLAAEHGVCGCHVHVAVPDRETAVQVCNHLRPWLPVLLTVTANSPIHQGVDTGYASWRSVLCGRWPCSGAPPFFASAGEYDQVVDMMIHTGAILDRAMVYWDVRPSDHLPTVEVRVADVPATVDGAVLLAVLVRALVTTALRDLDRGRTAPPVSAEAVRAAYWRAAHDGLAGTGIDLFTGRRLPARQLLRDLVRHVRPVLRESGELQAVNTLLTKLLLDGTGAHRQRAAFAGAQQVRDVVTVMASHTIEDCAPHTAA